MSAGPAPTRGHARRLGGGLALLLLAVTALAGCRADRTAAPSKPSGASGASGASGPSMPSGRSDATITVGGRPRSYHLYRPASAGITRPVALVVMLHGGFGSGGQAEDSYGWDAEADRHGFVVAYPDGLNRAWNVGGDCCGQPGRTGVDDVGFVVAMVGAIRDRLPVDPRRIYVTGISNGGMLSYRLACDSTLFAAAAPDAATQLGACPDPHPLSLLHLHGTADQNIPFAGGPGHGVARIDGPPVPDVVAAWRRTDACPAPRVSVAEPVTLAISDCPRGRAVELITISGAGHQWPGSHPRTAAEKLLSLDPPSTAVDATDTIWTFFERHPAPA